MCSRCAMRARPSVAGKGSARRRESRPGLYAAGWERAFGRACCWDCVEVRTCGEICSPGLLAGMALPGRRPRAEECADCGRECPRFRRASREVRS